MKIDKVLFSCSASAEYAPFWNVQSRIYNEQLGIEPVCLLYGRKSDTDMTETYGRIIEVTPDPTLPWCLQLVWSKFSHPTTEPDTTWLIGDIDLIPLQRAYFIDNIAHVPDGALAHLNAGGISQPRIGIHDGFLTRGPQRLAKDQGHVGGADLPGHYHVAKGRTFELFTQGRSLLDQVKHIVDADRYGIGPMDNLPKEKRTTDAYWYYWCAEETYSSEIIWNALRQGLDFRPFYYNNNNNCDRVNRDCFGSDYSYSAERAAAKQFVDVHCARPYARQAGQLKRLLEVTWGFSV